MEQELDLREYLEIIAKRKKLLIQVPLIAVIVSAIISLFFLKPVYEASTTLMVGKSLATKKDGAIDVVDYNTILANKQLAKTYGEIAKSRTVAQAVIEASGVQMEVEELQKMIDVAPVKDTELLKISVRDTDPRRAALLANTLAKEFSRRVIEIMKVDNVNIVDPAIVPAKPIKPRLVLNMVAAGIFGLIAAVLLIFLLEQLDTTIKTKEEAERLLDLPVLGVIPRSDE
ncbi:MAG: protein tyrosine kinase modulator [Eubacteriales bacterium]|nr:protein tyrosine kinase modulator [Eubacteriales bacterium]